MNPQPEQPAWPDALQPPDPRHIRALLVAFWADLACLADLLAHRQIILAAEQLHHLRGMVLELMLALNGIARPAGATRLNSYLGESQRIALEKTLRLPEVTVEALIAQAVALVVIYRWYAPQLLAVYGGAYPQAAEDAAWAELTAALPQWPQRVTTD